METKEKNLNNVQRKMLDKIYSDVMDEKTRDYNNLRSDKRKELVKSLTDSVNQKYKAKLKKLFDAMNIVGSLTAVLNEEGYTLKAKRPDGGEFYGSYIEDLVKSGNTPFFKVDSNKIPELKAFDEATKESQAKMVDLKNEIRADIYGLQITYSEIRAELDKKIEALNLA